MIALGTALFGQPRKRSGRRALWLCPWHDDHNPSLAIDVRRFRCWSCNVGGNAAALVMQAMGLTFIDALRWLAEWSGAAPPTARTLGGRAIRRVPVLMNGTAAAGRANVRPPKGPTGIDAPDARKLADDAASRLWRPDGADALAYLRNRGLADDTIGRARIGYAPRVAVPKGDASGTWTTGGITIPWFDRNGGLAKINVRRFGDARPKYIAVFHDRPEAYQLPKADDRAGAAAGPIDPSLPLVVVEGEFEALLLGQCLAGFANAITTGGANDAPGPAVYAAALTCPRWFAAHDADKPGERAAAHWAPRAARVRPPRGKDWTESHQAGIDLRLWWAVNHLPALFDHEERSAIRGA